MLKFHFLERHIDGDNEVENECLSTTVLNLRAWATFRIEFSVIGSVWTTYCSINVTYLLSLLLGIPSLQNQ